MQSAWMLVTESVLLGFGLAMDAFSVSLVNGLREPGMQKGKIVRIAAVFGGFQTVMPLIGWILVRTILELFQSLQSIIPWTAFGMLLMIGGKMLLEGIRNKTAGEDQRIGAGGLMLQGAATSIDALSVGLTMADTSVWNAIAESLLIGAVTFCVCTAGILIGRKAGIRLSGKASILGGLILIGIGIKILVTGI